MYAIRSYYVGVKASGGIRDARSAWQMIEAGADRIGTSSLIVDSAEAHIVITSYSIHYTKLYEIEERRSDGEDLTGADSGERSLELADCRDPGVVDMSDDFVLVQTQVARGSVRIHRNNFV